MNLFLVLTFLFFTGSLIGWGIEVFWRRFFSRNNPERKWINPGFLTGPYLPLYGLSLVIMFSLAMIDVSFVSEKPWVQKIVLFVLMALCITLLEFIAGLIFIRGMKIKLWDYSECRGNIKGIICPQYSFYWVILSALYYFLVHPKIIEWLYWFTNHIAFSFVVGFFYGVLTVDLCYTFNLSAKIRQYAKEARTTVVYETLKSSLQKHNDELAQKTSFILQFRTNGKGLLETLKEVLADKK